MIADLASQKSLQVNRDPRADVFGIYLFAEYIIASNWKTVPPPGDAYRRRIRPSAWEGPRTEKAIGLPWGPVLRGTDIRHTIAKAVSHFWNTGFPWGGPVCVGSWLCAFVYVYVGVSWGPHDLCGRTLTASPSGVGILHYFYEAGYTSSTRAPCAGRLRVCRHVTVTTKNGRIAIW